MRQARPHNRITGIALLVLSAWVWQGCEAGPMTTDPNPVPSSSEPGAFRGDGAMVSVPSASPWLWNTVAEAKVSPGKETVLTGSRYTLIIPKGALSKSTTITVSERHHGIVDVAFDPDGTTFDKPVTLIIDYAGSPNDPSSSFYHGLSPAFYQHDPGANPWIDVPGTDDPLLLTYTVDLEHFSRYAMGDGVVNTNQSRAPWSKDIKAEQK